MWITEKRKKQSKAHNQLMNQLDNCQNSLSPNPNNKILCANSNSKHSTTEWSLAEQTRHCMQICRQLAIRRKFAFGNYVSHLCENYAAIIARLFSSSQLARNCTIHWNFSFSLFSISSTLVSQGFLRMPMGARANLSKLHKQWVKLILRAVSKFIRNAIQF